jgi:peptidoglycan/xylan/chitin deacetylase (PgdA/CDA1 family)
MTKLEAALKKIAGVVPRYMRLPFGNGDTDPRVLGILGSLGYRAIMWDLDSGDTLGSSADQVIKYFEDRAIPPTPHIPVNHDSQLNTVNVTMPVIIDMLKQRGYSLETVGSCLGDENGYYKETTTPSSRDSTWVC